MVIVLNATQRVKKLSNLLKIISAFEFDFKKSLSLKELQEKTNLSTSVLRRHIRYLWASNIFNRQLFNYHRKGNLGPSVYFLNNDLDKREILISIFTIVDDTLTTRVLPDE